MPWFVSGGCGDVVECTYTNNAENGVGNEFEAVPVCAIFGLVKDKFTRAEGIECLEGDGGCHGAHEALPQGLVGEVV